MANRLQKQAVYTYVPAVPSVAPRAAYCQTRAVITGYRRVEEARYGAAAGGSSSSSSSSTSTRSTFISVDSVDGGVRLPAGAVAVYRPVMDSNGNYNNQLVGYSVPPSGGGSAGGSGAGGYAGSGRVPIYSTETVCYPAVQGSPGSPARIDASANNGWNGGARSILPVPVGGYFEATLPDSPLGVLVGLSDGLADHAYAHPSHGLVARPGGITPIEHGADVGDEVAVGQRVRMTRTADGVRMYVDGQLVHVSNTPIAGPAYVDATLYALSDFVDDPVIGLFHETSGVCELACESYLANHGGGIAELSMQAEGTPVVDGKILVSGTASMSLQSDAEAFALYAPDATAELTAEIQTAGYGVFGQPQSWARGISGFAHGRAALVGAASQGAIARAQGAFSRPVLEARLNRPEAEITQATGVFPVPTISAHMYSGGIMSAEGSMGMVGRASEADYFGGVAPAATVYRLAAWEAYLPDDQLDGGDMLFPLDSLRLDSAILFAITEGIELTDSIDLYLLINLEAYEAIGVADTVSLASILELAISERMAVNANVASARREALQYAVNAVTGALSRYEGFGFKQFARLGGQTYAITDAGLYRLEGQDDDGDPLNAAIDFGASDFGTAQAKRLSSVYAGIATDGGVYLRLTGDDGVERIYRAMGDSMERRAVTAKGLAARHWRLRLELVDATYADLDNVEFEVGVSQRRLRRGRS